MLNINLNNKVAIVTGGASGIGRAIARDLAEAGAAVVIADINAEGARKVEEELTAKGKKVLAVKTDVSIRTEMEKLIETTISNFAKLHIMVNNAGIIRQDQVVEIRDEDWDAILRTNLGGCYLGSQLAVRQMLEQGEGGRIVNISSIHAAVSQPTGGAYNAAKGAIEGFSRCLAAEVARENITVNVVRPGPTYTEITRPLYTEAVTKAIQERIPVGYIAQPEDISFGILFLVSDRARYITGQVLTIDGGYITDGRLPGLATGKRWSEI